MTVGQTLVHYPAIGNRVMEVEQFDLTDLERAWREFSEANRPFDSWQRWLLGAALVFVFIGLVSAVWIVEWYPFWLTAIPAALALVCVHALDGRPKETVLQEPSAIFQMIGGTPEILDDDLYVQIRDLLKCDAAFGLRYYCLQPQGDSGEDQPAFLLLTCRVGNQIQVKNIIWMSRAFQETYVQQP